VLAKVEHLRPRLLPSEVHVEVTRNYGETAKDKANELVEHLLIATLSVVVLISLAMDWRSGLVVGIAVPVTLALTPPWQAGAELRAHPSRPTRSATRRSSRRSP
jgi:multidrug efflux pump subunit AcrB